MVTDRPTPDGELEEPSAEWFSTQQPRTPTRNDEWWHERHALHDEAHHQAHRPLDLCVPLWSEAAVLAARADLLAQIEKAVLGLVAGDEGAFSGDVVIGWLIHRRAVLSLLAAIRSAAPVEPEE